MKIKIKKLHPDAIIPTYSKVGDAGMDLYCVSLEKTKQGYGDFNIEYKTGISLEIPKGYVGLIFPRSSISKSNLWLRNAVGVVDSGYRGEIICKFGYYKGLSTESAEYKKGDRIAQLLILPYPQIEFEEVDSLSETERGTGGFGSTGS